MTVLPGDFITVRTIFLCVVSVDHHVSFCDRNSTYIMKFLLILMPRDNV